MDPSLAFGTIQTLADRQGSVVDVMSEEEPGKILHEVRLDVSTPGTGSTSSYGDLHITNAPMAGGRITIDISGSTATVQGRPEGVVLHRGHRPWMTEPVEQADRRRQA